MVWLCYSIVCWEVTCPQKVTVWISCCKNEMFRHPGNLPTHTASMHQVYLTKAERFSPLYCPAVLISYLLQNYEGQWRGLCLCSSASYKLSWTWEERREIIAAWVKDWSLCIAGPGERRRGWEAQWSQMEGPRMSCLGTGLQILNAGKSVEMSDERLRHSQISEEESTKTLTIRANKLSIFTTSILGLRRSNKLSLVGGGHRPWNSTSY